MNSGDTIISKIYPAGNTSFVGRNLDSRGQTEKRVRVNHPIPGSKSRNHKEHLLQLNPPVQKKQKGSQKIQKPIQQQKIPTEPIKNQKSKQLKPDHGEKQDQKFIEHRTISSQKGHKKLVTTDIVTCYSHISLVDFFQAFDNIISTCEDEIYELTQFEKVTEIQEPHSREFRRKSRSYQKILQKERTSSRRDKFYEFCEAIQYHKSDEST